jgi:hypothetical protein
MHFLSVAFWPMGSYACVVPTTPNEKLVVFSCKRRGFCPSCGGRRMAQTAAHLVDHILPRVPVRQGVLSLPIPLRYLQVNFLPGVNKCDKTWCSSSISGCV